MRTPDIVNMKFGSHLYGLNTSKSDVDYKGIYLPTLSELLLGNFPKTYKSSTGGMHDRNAPGDIDTEVISLPEFIKHACNGETFAIDMLHCDNPISSSPIWEYLVANRTMFYSKDMKAYVGYVKKQASKYGLKGSRVGDLKKALDAALQYENVPHVAIGGLDTIDLQHTLYTGPYCKWVMHPKTGQEFYEVLGKKYQSNMSVGELIGRLGYAWDSYGSRAKEAEQNQGIDWKAVSHALRAGYQARDIYLKGDFRYPLHETQFLLKVKTGQLDYKTEVGPELERLVEEVDNLAKLSDYPEKVSERYWELWLIDLYDKEFRLT